MKTRHLVLAASLILLLPRGPTLAEIDHGHDHSEGSKAKAKQASAPKPHAHDHDEENEEADSHDEEEGHAHEKDEGDHGHGHGEEGEEEGGKNVGPNKGVTTFDERLGFTLSEEAKKSFGLKTISLSGSGPWSVPLQALVRTGAGKSVYRVRDGRFKAVEVRVTANNQTLIQSKDLTSGDSVVTQGAGFVRIAEVDVTSGESGHHH